MNRRKAIALSTAAVLSLPSTGRVEPAKRIYRVAVFDAIAFSEQHPNARAFFDGLHRLGYVRGENLIVERRDAGGQEERMAAVARDLVEWKPDLVVASNAGRISPSRRRRLRSRS